MAPHKSSLLPLTSGGSMSSHHRGRSSSGSTSRGLVGLLCTALLVAAVVQGVRWHSRMATDLALARRSASHFEAMYRSATEEGASWRTKFDQERRANAEEKVSLGAAHEAEVEKLQARLVEGVATTAAQREKTQQMEQEMEALRESLSEAATARKEAEVRQQQQASQLQEVKVEKEEAEAALAKEAAARRAADAAALAAAKQAAHATEAKRAEQSGQEEEEEGEALPLPEVDLGEAEADTPDAPEDEEEAEEAAEAAEEEVEEEAEAEAEEEVEEEAEAVEF